MHSRPDPEAVTISPAESANAGPPALKAGHLGGRILKWSLLIALGPMLLLAGQGYHCAREAVLDTAVERVTQLTTSRKAERKPGVAKTPSLRSGHGDPWTREATFRLEAFAGRLGTSAQVTEMER